MSELIIHDGNYQQHINTMVGGWLMGKGGVPRDRTLFPAGCYASAKQTKLDIPTFPRTEWAERIRDKDAQKSWLSDIRDRGDNGKPIPTLNQGSYGYCWAHSTTQAIVLLRAKMNAPYVPLSAFSVAATIKQGRNEGGWGAQSLDFITSRGVVAQSLWPQGDANYRQYDTPEVWANAALHKAAESWVDLDAAQYDRKFSFDAECTLLMCDDPVVKDENWWSHSIVGVQVVNGNTRFNSTRVESGKLATTKEFELIWGIGTEADGFGIKIWNSWSNDWGENGTGILTGTKAISDGCVSPRATLPSAA